MTNGRRTVLLVTHLYHSGKYEELQRVAGSLNGCSSCSLARSENGWHFGILEMLGTEAAQSARVFLNESQEWGLSGQYLGDCQGEEPSGRISDSHQQQPSERRAFEPAAERRTSAESARATDEPVQSGRAAAVPAIPPVPETTAIAAAKLGLMDSLGNEAALVQKVKNVTFEMLAEHFESGLKEAAAALGLSPTSLKRACRKLGIRKWPRRELKRKAECGQASPPPPELAQLPASGASHLHDDPCLQQVHLHSYSDQGLVDQGAASPSQDEDRGYEILQPEDQRPAKVHVQADHRRSMHSPDPRPSSSPSLLGREASNSPFRAWMHTGKWGSQSDAASGGSAAVAHKLRAVHARGAAGPGLPDFRPAAGHRGPNTPSPVHKSFSTDAAVQRILESRADASRAMPDLQPQRSGQAYLHRCVPVLHISERVSRPHLQSQLPGRRPPALIGEQGRVQPAPSDSETISETSSGQGSDRQPIKSDPYQ